MGESRTLVSLQHRVQGRSEGKSMYIYHLYTWNVKVLLCCMKSLCHGKDMPNKATYVEAGEKRGLFPEAGNERAHWVGKLIMIDMVLNFCQEMALVVFCP